MGQRSRRRTGRVLLGLVATAGVLFLSNPGRADHEERIREMVRERSPAASLLGGGWLASKMIEYRSYGLLSAGYLDGERVTLGVLGRVF